jgi:CubicO group peptidase (beta-lactamase class C family)
MPSRIKTQERVDRISAVADRYVSSGSFSSIEWAIDVDGSSLSVGKIGKADQETGADVPDGALYRIYSMTKPLISVLALQLIEQGRLRLSDLLPQFDDRFARMMVLTPEGQIQAAERPITVEDLLTHRAGFTYEFVHGCHIAQYYREAKLSYNNDSLDEMMGNLATLPLGFHPGSKYGYGVSTDVLAHVIERATGRGVDTLLADQIFEPLGMEDTAYYVPEEKQSRLITMYGREGFLDAPALAVGKQELVLVDVTPYYPVNSQSFRRGGIGLYSTLADYRKFAIMLLDGKSADGEVLLSRKMVQMMSVNRIAPHQGPVGFGPGVMKGYGWGMVGRLLVDQGQTMSLASTGELSGGGGASTYFWVDPSERMTGVIMTQYLGASLPMAADLQTAAYQALS